MLSKKLRMATIKFRVLHKSENAQIYLRFSLGRENVFQGKTGKTINYKNWSSKTGKPVQTQVEFKKLAIELKDLESFILKEYNIDYAKGVIFTKAWLDEKISFHFKRIDVKSDDSVFLNYLKDLIQFRQSITMYSKESTRKFINLQQKFMAYQEHKKKIYLLDEIDARTLTDFKSYLISDFNLMESTASGFIKSIKTVLFNARYQGKNIHHQVSGFKAGSTNAEATVFLSFQEIEQIKHLQTADTDLCKARDWLVLGCFLGQRGGDLFKMNKSMIYSKIDSDGDSFRFIEFEQEKPVNKKKVVIPLHIEVENILSKYGGGFPSRFSDEKGSNMTLFNRHIKVVCELAGIHEMVKGKVFDDDQKKYEYVETEKCFLVSSHICRRSFATNFYGNKSFTTPEIMAITGHDSPATFLIYIGKTADDWAMQTAKTFREISNSKK